MQASWQKWVPLTGILFVVLFIVGIGFASGPENNQSDQEIVDWYAKSSHQTSVIIGAYVLAVAGVAFLLFVNRLRAVVAAAEGPQPIFATFIFASGVIFVVGLAIAAGAMAAVSGGVKFGDQPNATNADVVRFLPQLGFGALLLGGIFPLIFGLFTTAIASMRLNIFPSWFNWLTIICAIILFFAALFLPLIALGVWLIAASIQLMKHQPGATAAA